MYKLFPIDPLSGKAPACVQNTANSTIIPFDPANTDYQAYLKWLEEGNTPEPAEEPQ